MRIWLASVADGAAVLLFAAVGRLSHAEGVTPLGVLEVAWPFLVGGAVGTVAGRTWRRPESLPSGAAVWAGTLVGGILFRALTGGGVSVSFVLVAGIVLAVMQLGWRLVMRATSDAAHPSSIGGAPR
ncbi:MAG TPA: DUF3054 domain-containing protein [Propionibacteriaceae bacterium]|nr:DUF3054 domain-containing protein [Propionibacteriaceae bacterium]